MEAAATRLTAAQKRYGEASAAVEAAQTAWNEADARRRLPAHDFRASKEAQANCLCRMCQPHSKINSKLDEQVYLARNELDAETRHLEQATLELLTAKAVVEALK